MTLVYYSHGLELGPFMYGVVPFIDQSIMNLLFQ